MIFRPNLLLPSQLDYQIRISGCISLQMALIESAINEIESRDRRIREAALEWITSGRHGIGSFLFACDIVGLDPERFRKWAAQVRPPKVKPRRILRYVY